MNIIARLLAVTLSLIIAVALLNGCKKAAHQELIIGMELGYPPFEMTDPQGQPAGVSVEMAHALGEYLHRAVKIENIPFDGLIPSLKTSKIDCIISSMTATPARAEVIAFSEPYLHTGLTLLVASKSPVQSIADADQTGRTIAVKKGTTGEVYASKNIHRAKVLTLAQENACVLEVVQGRVDAFIYDQISTYQNWRKNEQTTRPLLQPFQQESWAIGLRKDDADLQAKVNAFLQDYRAKGGFKRLGDQFLSEQKAAFKARGVPFLF